MRKGLGPWERVFVELFAFLEKQLGDEIRVVDEVNASPGR
jgi:hypothetical protein